MTLSTCWLAEQSIEKTNERLEIWSGSKTGMETRDNTQVHVIKSNAKSSDNQEITLQAIIMLYHKQRLNINMDIKLREHEYENSYKIEFFLLHLVSFSDRKCNF